MRDRKQNVLCILFILIAYWNDNISSVLSYIKHSYQINFTGFFYLFDFQDVKESRKFEMAMRHSFMVCIVFLLSSLALGGLQQGVTPT